MEYFTLNNDMKIPKLGFGAMISGDDTENVVAEALNSGYRLIDTAAIYQNETAVGRGMKKSGVLRDQIILETKLWIQDTGYEATKREFDKQLQRLGVDYIDIYLIHKPWGDIFGSWRAMSELQKAGKIRVIGVSNFYPDRLMDLIVNTGTKPMINQIENNPLFQQNDSVQFMHEQGVRPEAWAPFAQGKSRLFTNPVLTEIAQNHHKSTGQVVLRWNLQRGVLSLAKTVHTARMQENMDIFDFNLSDSEMAQIKTLDTHQSQFYDHHDPAMVKRISEWTGDF